MRCWWQQRWGSKRSLLRNPQAGKCREGWRETQCRDPASVKSKYFKAFMAFVLHLTWNIIFSVKFKAMYSTQDTHLADITTTNDRKIAIENICMLTPQVLIHPVILHRIKYTAQSIFHMIYYSHFPLNLDVNL